MTLRAIGILTVLLLAGCNRPQEETIDAVPPPSADAANALMAEAERAAANAQARSTDIPTTNNSQGNNQ